jgi:CDP-4-dehydro-6-deoxyglucose reductase
MFTIENQATGKVFRTDGDGAILDDALIHGLNFPYGCQKGFCGKCKATALPNIVRTPHLEFLKISASHRD